MNEEKNAVIVKDPVREWPNYELSEGATVEEMRAMAVKVMRDELTFQWTPDKDFQYRKSGACANKNYEFPADRVYVGLPYSSGGTGLFHWLQYYDMETGVFHVPEDPDFMWKLGNSCAASVNWGMSAVCSSMRGGVSTYGFVYRNNLYPLGDVKYPAHIQNFEECATDTIVEMNGEKAVLEGYALLHAGDAVIATDRYPTQLTARHAMMVVADPVVVRNEDGSINPEESYIIEQDQRSKDKMKETDDPDYQVSMRGRVDHPFTFADLLKGDYIAISTLEFLGLKPYEVGKAQWSRCPEDLESLFATKVLTNYRMVTIQLNFTDEAGKTVSEKIIPGEGSLCEQGFSFGTIIGDCFEKEKITGLLASGKKYTCEAEVLLNNGGIRKTEAFTFTA